MTHESLPCTGLRVIDLGQDQAAIAGMILADYGAEVVKIEPPGGEFGRSRPAFHQWNRGKRSAIFDLHRQSEREALAKLAASADVLIHNFRPSSAERFGVDGAELCKRNPRLVHVGISGFGSSHPLRNMKGYEGIVAAATGQFAIQNGYRDDGPIYDAIPKGIFGAAMLALVGTLAALEVREQTGRGQRVDTSLLQSNFVYSYTGIRAERREIESALSQVQGRDPHNEMPGYRIAECADGVWLQSGSATGRIFANMLRALGIDDAGTDGLGATGDQELLARIDETFRTATSAEWMRRFDEHDAAYGEFLTTQQFMDHPQVRHNGHVVAFDDAVLGATEQLGPLVSFVGSAWRHPGPAPAIGTVGLPRFETTPPRSEVSPDRPAVDSRRPLAGITVLDLSMFAAAPGGPGLLADLGARVIKVEPPTGDPLGANEIGGNELFFRVNRGKERIALDLKHPEGRAILHRLVTRSHVLVHNFRPGVPERLGADYETSISHNPRLVHVYASSFGSGGPDAHRPAFDAVISAMAGGEVLQAGAGNPPQQRQTTDHSALLTVAVAILLGLREQRRTGRPQRVETTMLASAAYLLSDDFIRFEGKPPRPQPDRGQHGPNALYRLYRAAARTWVFLACPRADEWARLCSAIGRTELVDDPRFWNEAQRVANDEELAAALGEVFAERPAGEWERALLEEDLACVEPAPSWTEVALNPDHALLTPLRTSFDWPGAGHLEQTGAAVLLSSDSGEVNPPEPFAASTARVLEELGRSPAEIDRLASDGVVILADRAG